MVGDFMAKRNNDGAENYLKGERNIATYYNVEFLSLILFWADMYQNHRDDPKIKSAIESIVTDMNTDTMKSWLNQINAVRNKDENNEARKNEMDKKIDASASRISVLVKDAVMGVENAIETFKKSYGSFFNIAARTIVASEGRIEVSNDVTWSGNNTENDVFFMITCDIEKNVMNTGLPRTEVMSLMRTGADTRIKMNYGNFVPCSPNDEVSSGYVEGSKEFVESLRKLLSTIPELASIAEIPARLHGKTYRIDIKPPLFQMFCHAMLDVNDPENNGYSGILRDRVTYTHWIPFADNLAQNTSGQVKRGSATGETIESSGNDGGFAEGNQAENNRRMNDQATGAEVSQDELHKKAHIYVAKVVNVYNSLTKLAKVTVGLNADTDPIEALNRVCILLKVLISRVYAEKSVTFYTVTGAIKNGKSYFVCLSNSPIDGKTNRKADAVNMFNDMKHKFGDWVETFAENDAQADGILRNIKKLFFFNDHMYNDYIREAYNVTNLVSMPYSTSGELDVLLSTQKKIADTILERYAQCVVTEADCYKIARKLVLTMYRYRYDDISDITKNAIYQFVKVCCGNQNVSTLDDALEAILEDDGDDVLNTLDPREHTFGELLGSYEVFLADNTDDYEPGAQMESAEQPSSDDELDFDFYDEETDQEESTEGEGSVSAPKAKSVPTIEVSMCLLLDGCVFNPDGNKYGLADLLDALKFILGKENKTDENPRYYVNDKNRDILIYCADKINKCFGSNLNIEDMLHELNAYKKAIDNSAEVAEIETDGEPRGKPKETTENKPKAKTRTSVGDLDMLEF